MMAQGAAFDQLASTYDVAWTNSTRGRAQRNAVWREIDGLFRAGDRVLDLGCGTGEDALHLDSRGVRVHAIDASPEMVRTAQARGVNAEVLRIEDLDQLDGAYDGAISNFGALNCVADLPAVGASLARLIRPGGWLAICLMPRLCWTEILRFEFRRWRREAAWRGIHIYYPSAHQVARALPGFVLVRRRSIAWGDHCFFLFKR
jgi:ubiquinone/menaquinone biosynthesis C-methylase UbiE